MDINSLTAKESLKRKAPSKEPSDPKEKDEKDESKEEPHKL
jgi:hypothetical protein